MRQLTRMLQMNPSRESALFGVVFILSKSPGGHAIYHRNERVSQMQCVTQDWPTNVERLPFVRKFRGRGGLVMYANGCEFFSKTINLIESLTVMIIDL